MVLLGRVSVGALDDRNGIRNRVCKEPSALVTKDSPPMIWPKSRNIKYFNKIQM